MPNGESTQYRQDQLRVDELCFDARNPRLPEKVRGGEQRDVLRYIAEEYDAIAVARSIASHGYFPSEPLIVLREGDKLVVVEGNRRLAALKLLRDPVLRAEIGLAEEDKWDGLARRARIPDTVPVILVDDRRKVAPIVGYRHISGIEKWDPWAKARFIANLVDEEELQFNQVAEEVGDVENTVKASYRNYAIVQRAREFGIPTDRAEARFGVFTRAMNSPELRGHIGAPADPEVIKGRRVVPKERASELAELLAWLFGTDESNAVMGESRQITRLGKVAGSETGLFVLRSTGNLEEAYIAVGGLKERLLERINKARVQLENAEGELPQYASDPQVIDLLRQCKAVIDRLLLVLSLETEEANGHPTD